MHDACARASVRIVRKAEQHAFGAEFKFQGLDGRGAWIRLRHHGRYARAARGFAAGRAELGDRIKETSDDLSVGLPSFGGRGAGCDRDFPAGLGGGAF